MSVYSFSQVSTYKQCGLKYRYQYIDKIPTPDFIESADSILGNTVHETLEKLYNDVNEGKVPEIELLMDYYRDLWNKKKEELGGIIPVHGDQQLDDFIQRGKHYIQTYYDKHFPFDNIKVIGTELNFTFDLYDDIKFRGIVDRLDKIEDTFVINDYKTVKKLPTEDKEKFMDQLTLYGIGIKQQYGKYFEKLKAKLHFVHFDIEDERELTDEKIQTIANKYIAIIQDIENKKTLYSKGNKKIFEPTKSALCAYCPFQTICPLFNYINNDGVVSGLSEKTLTTLVDEIISIKTQISDLKKQEEGLKEIFTEYVENKESDTGIYLLPGTEKDLKITEDESYKTLDKEALIQKTKEIGIFDKVAEVPYHVVNKMFKDNEADIDEFANIIGKETGYKITAVKKKK